MSDPFALQPTDNIVALFKAHEERQKEMLATLRHVAADRDAKENEVNRLQRELAEARGLADPLRIAALVTRNQHDFDRLIDKLRGETER